MEKNSRKILSVILSLLMIVTVIPIGFADTALKASAAVSSTKVYDTEYYYPSGSTFVSYMAVFYSSSNSKAKDGITNAGYNRIGKDLNDGAGGEYIYAGYKTSTNIAEAARSIQAAIDGSSTSHDADTRYSKTPVSNNKSCLFTAVGVYPASHVTGAADGKVDLNKGAGGRDIYLYISKDPAAGPPIITRVDYSGNNEGGGLVRTDNGDWWNVVGTDDSSNDNQTCADMNRGCGGRSDDIYLYYGVARTTVNSNNLRTAYSNAQTYLSNATRYTKESIANLQSACTACESCLTALNTYAASTYTQSNIDTYTSNINSAINALKTIAFFNVNTGGVNTNLFAPSIVSTSAYGLTLSYNASDDTYTLNGTQTASTGTLARGYFRPDAATYTVSVTLVSGSKPVGNGCVVLDMRQSDGSNTSTRMNTDFNGSVNKALTFTSATANECCYIDLWVWHNSVANVFSNFKFKIKVEKAGAKTDHSPEATVFTIGSASSKSIASAQAPTQTKTGYLFNGWSSSSTATSGTAAGSNITTGFNQTWYAAWNPITYTVEYNGNGSTGGSTASSSHTYDVSKALTSNGFSRAYTVTYNANGGSCNTSSATATATFNGWNTNSGGTGTSYTNQQSVKNLSSTQDATVTLYAQWNLGSVTLPSASKAYDTTYHYSFSGWYDASSGGNRIGNGGASYTPTAAKTLYAQYTPIAHVYTTSVENAATCTSKGTTRYTCNCGYSYTAQDIPMAAHNYTNTVSPDYLVSAADCNNPAVYHKSCSACGAAGTETFTNGAALGHDWNTGTLTKTANCVEKGEKTFTCNRCSTTRKEEIAINPSNHKTVVNDPAVAPNCIATGLSSGSHCSACNTVINAQTVVPALGHTPGSAATCTTAQYCTVCLTELHAALGHSMTLTAAKAATCLAAGNNAYYTCSVCSGVFRDIDGNTPTTVAAETLTKKDHAYTGAVKTNADGTHSFKCVNGCNQYGGTVACTFGNWTNSAEPTCTDQGAKFRVCSVCSYRQTEVINANGHSYVLTESSPATCETAGNSAYYTCSVCGKYFNTAKTEITENSWVIPATGHDWNSGVWTWSADGRTASITFTCINNGNHTQTVNATVNGDEKTAAGCLTTGTTTYTATAIFKGETYTDTKDVQDIPALGHDSGEWQVITKASCTANGSKKLVCGRCGTTLETAVINARNHDYGEWSVTTPATCYAEGVKTRYCAHTAATAEYEACSAIETAAVAKTAHTPSAAVTENNVPPTCTAGGSYDEVVYCSVAECRAEISRTKKTVGQLGHSFTNYVSDDNATCTGNRTETSKCDRCDVTDTRTVADSALGHELTKTEATAPTCVLTGNEAYWTCSRCRKLFSDAEGNTEVTLAAVTIPATGHDSGTWTVTSRASCTSNGNKNLVCGVCGTIIRSETIQKRGHDLGGWTVTKNPNCTDAGSKIRTCTNTATTEYDACDYSETESIPATGHSYGNPVFNWNNYLCATATFTCVNSGCTHTENADVTVTPATTAATCTADGQTVYTASCSFGGNNYTDTKTQNLTALGHNFGAWTFDSAMKKHTRVCANNPAHTETADCGFNSVVSQKATCTADGVRTYTCTVCNGQYTETIAKRNHSWGGYTQTLAPTCTEAGEKIRYCANTAATEEYAACSASDTASIAPLGHDEINHPASAADCENIGWDAYVTCSRCDYTTYNEIPALGHDFGNATCTDAAVCSRCGLSTGEPIGHDWEYAFTWNGTGSCTCVRTCKRNASHTGTAVCTITSETVDATCEAAGKTTYTATAVFSDATKTEDKVVAISATGHDYTGDIQQVADGTHNYACANGCGTYGVGTVKNAVENCEWNAPEFEWTGYATCTATFACADCGGTHEANCVITNETTLVPTCVAEGTKVYTAAVSFGGDDFTDTKTETLDIDASNHDLETKTAKTATCEGIGWNEYVICKREGCSYTTYSEIPALGHDYSGAANCVTDGSHNYACANGCGTYGIGTTRNATEDCVYGEPVFVWTGYTACSAVFTCSVCRDTYTVDTSITSEVTVAPTCAAEGAKVYTASVTFGGNTYTGTKSEVLDRDPDNHDIVNHTAQAATCEGIGWNAYVTCSRCAYTTYSEIPALGHDYSGDANCVSDGTHNYACANGCGTYGVGNVKNAVENCEWGEPEFAWTGYTACEATFVCDVCGGTHTENASVTSEVTLVPTCVAEGTKAYTAAVSFGGENYTDTKNETLDVDASNHDLETKTAKAPTCEAVGWNEYVVCKRDGCSYTTYSEIPALGHNYNGAVRNVTDGKHNFACANGCGTYGVGTTKDATADCVYGEPVFAWTGYTACTATFTCSVCRDEYTVDCEMSEEVTSGASCNESGTKRHTATVTLGETYTDTKDEVLGILGHSFTNYVSNNDATCVADGTKTAKCDRCDVTDTIADAGSALGHAYVAHEAKAATCGEGGWNAYRTCSRCDYTEFEAIGALGHNIENHSAKAATCTEKGWNAYKTCTRCDYTTYEEIAPLGHSLTHKEAKAATCRIDGNIEYWYCAACRGYFLDSEGENATTAAAIIISKSTVAHTPGTARKENVVAKTCTSDGGYDMVTRCTVCNVVTGTEHFTDPTTGHFGGTATCQSLAVCESCGQTYGSYADHRYGYKTTPATCATDGYTVRTCIYCAYSEITDTIPMTGHRWNGGVTTKEASYTAYGEITYTCSVCGGTKIDSIPMLECDHVDEDEDGLCDVCGSRLGSGGQTNPADDDDDGREHGDTSKKGIRCPYCDWCEANEGRPVVGWIYKVLHWIFHFVYTILAGFRS